VSIVGKVAAVTGVVVAAAIGFAKLTKPAAKAVTKPIVERAHAPRRRRKARRVRRV
jgi:hypothetical protein